MTGKTVTVDAWLPDAEEYDDPDRWIVTTDEHEPVTLILGADAVDGMPPRGAFMRIDGYRTTVKAHDATANRSLAVVPKTGSDGEWISAIDIWQREIHDT